MKQIIKRDLDKDLRYAKYHRHGLFNTHMYILETEEETKNWHRAWKEVYKRAGYKFISPKEDKVKGGEEVEIVLILSLVKSPWFIAMLVILLMYLAYKIYSAKFAV
jgi:hypothetical protein